MDNQLFFILSALFQNQLSKVQTVAVNIPCRNFNDMYTCIQISHTAINRAQRVKVTCFNHNGACMSAVGQNRYIITHTADIQLNRVFCGFFYHNGKLNIGTWRHTPPVRAAAIRIALCLRHIAMRALPDKLRNTLRQNHLAFCRNQIL